MTDTQTARPLIAIVTPSYNQAEFLEQTICSVLEQKGRGTDFDLEYAVIDGGSTDGSADIIRQYQSELAYWCSEPDRGQSHAINKGFEQVSGDLCAYINSDDYYLPDAFRRVVKSVQEHAQADLHHGICHKVDAEGNYLQNQIGRIRELAEIVDLWNYWLRPGGPWNFIQPEVFWTGRLARRIGSFNESLHYTMDFDYWLRGFDGGMEVATVPAPLAAFRVHAAQKTSAQDASILELLDRVEPFLRGDDDRIEPCHRARMQSLARLTRCRIAHADSDPTRQVAALATLAKNDPTLLRSKHFWKQFRRSGRRVLVPRRRAA